MEGSNNNAEIKLKLSGYCLYKYTIGYICPLQKIVMLFVVDLSFHSKRD